MKTVPDFAISGMIFKQYTSNCIYIWRRGVQYLYVGISGSGITRPLKHNKIDVIEKVLDTDIIEVWFYPNYSWEELEALEKSLIKKHKPLYNSSRYYTSIVEKPSKQVGSVHYKNSTCCLVGLYSTTENVLEVTCKNCLKNIEPSR